MNRRHFNAGTAALWLGMALAAEAKTPGVILVVGDSLSAEYGLKRGSGWVALLAQRLSEQKKPVAVVNASISGDTTSGGRSRLGALLAQHKPTVVVIELGGNDALRGLPLQTSQDNLQSMVQACLAIDAKVLLLGMQVPPNYGSDYSAQFAAMYASVAKTKGVALVPFFLKGVADVPDSEKMFQNDRIHPLEAAHPLLLNNVWPALSKLIA